jgi:hypothetical protein
MVGASIDVPLGCRCGHVRGLARVSLSAGFRFVCYCRDCQACVDFPIIVWGVRASAAMHMPKIQGPIENE